MSLKLETIYNYGGGGGGLKYGGALADENFIKIENNFIYDYTNLNRPELNFYVETDKDIAFVGALQIKTDVNTTVNVYKLKNGIYYLLGCVSSRDILANDSAKVFILGDSYEVETLSSLIEPKIFKFGSQEYEVIKIGDLFWTTSNAVNDYDDFGLPSYWPIGKPSNQSTYPGFFYSFGGNDSYYQKAKEKLYPFRIPLDSDYNKLIAAVNNQTNNIMKLGWPQFPNANNSSGFSCVPCGVYQFGDGVSLRGYAFNMLFEVEDGSGNLKGYYYEGTVSGADNAQLNKTTPGSAAVGNLRFCMDV